MTLADAAPMARLGGRPLGWLARQPASLRLAAALIASVTLAAALAGVLSPYDPNHVDVWGRLADPSPQHWLGTDQLGRDTLTRLLYGARVTLAVAMICTGAALAIGMVLGLVAGAGPAWLRLPLMLVFDSLNALPTTLMAMAVVTLTGPSLQTVMGLIVLFYVPYFGRVVAVQTQTLLGASFIEAERALGASRLRIMRDHLAPNLLGPMLIIASMEVPVVIGLEAGLSFLGLGIRPPTPSWGGVLQDGYAFIRDTPWLAIAGGAPLILLTLAFTVVGEHLRDHLDPRLRKAIG